jgi:hypothetical protein
MNSSQARVPPSLAAFGWVGNGERTRGPHGPLASPSSRPPGERSPGSSAYSHAGCRPEFFDWPRSLGNLRSGPPASVSQMVESKPIADWLRPGSKESHSFLRALPLAEHGLGTCPEYLPKVLVPSAFPNTSPPSNWAPSTSPRWPTRDEQRGLGRCEMGFEGPGKPNDVLRKPGGQAAGPGRVDREKGLSPVAARAKCKSDLK